MSDPTATRPDDAPDEAPDDDLLAAEYVLGTLSPKERATVQARAALEAALATSIASWERRLAPLAELSPTVPPPPVLWQRLALASGIESVIQSPRRPRNPWRLATIGASAVAASLALALLARPAPPPVQLAALSAIDGPGTIFLIRLEPNGAATILATGTPDIPLGRSLELWAVRPGATVPESLGLLPATGRLQLAPSPNAVPPGTTLLVSQEPQGGSPTRLPTGPVVYKGLLTGI